MRAEPELAKSRNPAKNSNLVQPSLLQVGAAYGHEVVDGLGAAVLARDEERSAANGSEDHDLTSLLRSV